MLVLEGGTMRETMDDLGHTSLTVAVDSYQRVVREHHLCFSKLASAL